jgi:hypothetical protein
VQALFLKHAENTKIIIASRFKETAVYQIRNIGIKLPETKAAYSYHFNLCKYLCLTEPLTLK